MNYVHCNKCGKGFYTGEDNLSIIKKDDLTVQYFSCPYCEERYHVFTADAQMQALIEQRKAVQLKIKAAFAKKFREKTIRKYEKELDQIKRQQKKLLPELKAAGEKILKGESQ